jgi:cytochrome c biogenesis protein CcmG/thiol:disulfide interchange protein DsbE
VLLNFWASWCYPACYEEAPVLESTWRAYRERGLVVLGIDIQDTEAAGRRFIQQFGLTFPNAPDPKGKVSIDYGVYGVPETFLIDRRGMIWKHVGAVTEAVFRGGSSHSGESAANGGAQHIQQDEGRRMTEGPRRRGGLPAG